MLTSVHRSPVALRMDAFVDRCEALLRDLFALHPGFAGLHFVTPSPERPPALAQDLSNLRPWLLEHGWDRQLANAYSERDAAGEVTPASVGPFTLHLSNWEGFDRGVSLRVHTGVLAARTGFAEGACTLTLPRQGHPEFLGGPLPLELLACVNRHWPISFGQFTTGGLHHAVNRDEPRDQWIRTVPVGWLTYVNDPGVAEALPPGVAVQRLGTGIVFQKGPRMPDFHDPGQVAALREVREALRSRDRLSSVRLR